MCDSGFVRLPACTFCNCVQERVAEESVESSDHPDEVGEGEESEDLREDFEEETEEGDGEAEGEEEVATARTKAKAAAKGQDGRKNVGGDKKKQGGAPVDELICRKCLQKDGILSAILSFPQELA